jgi:hypothetical protein
LKFGGGHWTGRPGAAKDRMYESGRFTITKPLGKRPIPMIFAAAWYLENHSKFRHWVCADFRRLPKEMDSDWSLAPLFGTVNWDCHFNLLA